MSDKRTPQIDQETGRYSPPLPNGEIMARFIVTVWLRSTDETLTRYAHAKNTARAVAKKLAVTGGAGSTYAIYCYQSAQIIEEKRYYPTWRREKYHWRPIHGDY